MNTAEFLTISAAMVPERTAVVGEDEPVSYGELQSRVNQLAQAMQALGIGKGHNVGIMAVNSPAFVEIYYATAAVGATFVPLNYRAKTEELTYMVNAADVSILFVAERYWSLFQEIKPASPGVQHAIPLDFSAPGYQSFTELRDSGEDIPVFADVDDGDPALIIYTSGTTSMPKGVVLTHRALTALVVNTQSPADPSQEQEVVLVSVPFYHIAGATTVVSAIFSGRRLVVLPAFDPQAWLAAVERERVTHAFVVPTMLKRLMEVDDFDQYDLSSLRLITYGAAPMPFEVARTACDVFPPRGIGLMNAYGQTEATGSMTFLGPDDHRLDGTPEENEQKIERLRSVGRPMPDIQISIMAPDGRILPANEEGEICIRGDRIMRGYHKRDEETGEAIRDGWLHTGDVGRLDEGGYLFITGRLKDMIIRGGENIAPAEIENVLEDHPMIAEAAVIGVSDTEWGEVIKAIVVADPPGRTDLPGEEELTTYVKSRLASYKAPALYQWVDSLPRNSLGKVLKTELREMYGQRAPSTSA